MPRRIIRLTEPQPCFSSEDMSPDPVIWHVSDDGEVAMNIGNETTRVSPEENRTGKARGIAPLVNTVFP